LNAETLKSIMLDLEFNTQDLSLLMGVTRRAVQLWTSGRNPIPQPVALLLLALAENRLTLEWIVERLPPIPATVDAA